MYKYPEGEWRVYPIPDGVVGHYTFWRKRPWWKFWSSKYTEVVDSYMGIDFAKGSTNEEAFQRARKEDV